MTALFGSKDLSQKPTTNMTTKTLTLAVVFVIIGVSVISLTFAFRDTGTFMANILVRPKPTPLTTATPTPEPVQSIEPTSKPTPVPTPKPVFTSTPIPIPTPVFIATPIPTPVAKNYRYEAILRANLLISINESFRDWLQDTSNQLRTASSLLANSSSSGLSGRVKELAILSANKQITIISGLIEKVNQDIVHWEYFISLLNEDTRLFVSKADINSLEKVETLKGEIVYIKGDINRYLDNVMSTLKY